MARRGRPYFLRALARTALNLGLERYVDAVEITEMARLEQTLP